MLPEKKELLASLGVGKMRDVLLKIYPAEDNEHYYIILLEPVNHKKAREAWSQYGETFRSIVEEHADKVKHFVNEEGLFVLGYRLHYKKLLVLIGILRDIFWNKNSIPLTLSVNVNVKLKGFLP